MLFQISAVHNCKGQCQLHVAIFLGTQYATFVSLFKQLFTKVRGGHFPSVDPIMLLEHRQTHSVQDNAMHNSIHPRVVGLGKCKGGGCPSGSTGELQGGGAPSSSTGKVCGWAGDNSLTANTHYTASRKLIFLRCTWTASMRVRLIRPVSAVVNTITHMTTIYTSLTETSPFISTTQTFTPTYINITPALISL